MVTLLVSVPVMCTALTTLTGCAVGGIGKEVAMARNGGGEIYIGGTERFIENVSDMLIGAQAQAQATAEKPSKYWEVSDKKATGWSLSGIQEKMKNFVNKPPTQPQYMEDK